MRKKLVLLLLIGLLLLINLGTCIASTTYESDSKYQLIYQTVYNVRGDASESKKITEAILQYSGIFGIDPFLATAQFKAESGFDISAVSSCGAIGIAQVMPTTAAAYCDGNDYTTIDGNIYTGIHYISEMVATYSKYGDMGVTLAVAAYNAGTGNVTDSVPNFTETLNYVEKVSTYYATLTGGNPLSASSNTTHWWSSFTKTIYLNIDFDFASQLRDVINTISNQCTAGIELIKTDVKWLFFVLVLIDFAVAAMFNLFDPDGEDIFNWLFKRFLKYGFILYMIVNWGNIVANVSMNYFVEMGAKAAGSTYSAAGLILSDPTSIVQKGAYIIGPVFAYIKTFYGIKFLIPGSIILILVALLQAFVILICFIIVGFEIMLAYLEFYVLASLSVVTLGFAPLKHTKFVGEKGVGLMLGASIKLMLYSYFSVVMTEVIKNYSLVTYSFESYLRVMLIAILFVVFLRKVTSTAGKLLYGGNPNF